MSTTLKEAFKIAQDALEEHHKEKLCQGARHDQSSPLTELVRQGYQRSALHSKTENAIALLKHQVDDLGDAERFREFMTAIIADYNGEPLNPMQAAIKKAFDGIDEKLSIGVVRSRIDRAIAQERGRT